jgi:SAM-dependent MidA family methyltransferase
LTELEDELRATIRRDGPIPFRDVMQAALYHPRHGYYTNLRGFGADGDFITSPERHPAFGWLLGRQALEVWHALDLPRPFRITELGAGSGALAESLVGFLRGEGVFALPAGAARTAARPAGDVSAGAAGTDSEAAPRAIATGKSEDPALVFTLEEVSPTLRAVQRQRLTDPAFRWADGEEQAHFVIANEVADALPVHRVIVRGGRLRELHVGLDDQGDFTWVETDGARPELEAYFEALHYLPPEGSIADVCLELADWVAGLARRLDDRAVGLVMDYAASPPRDTLLTYYRHAMGSDPLVQLGERDISAHVDLRTLVRLAIANGLRAGATAQRGLLLNLGFQQVVGKLGGPTDRMALGALVDADGLGGQIAAVFLIRGLPDYKPIGAIGGREWPEPKEVPSLPPDPDEADFLNQWREAFPH